LLGCWADAAALEREAGVCRKAAKKVDRKKGRCDDMVSFRGGTRGKVVFRGRMVSRPSRGLEFSMWRGRWPGCDICFLGHRVRQCTRLRAVVGVWTVGVGLSLMSPAVSMAAWAGGCISRSAWRGLVLCDAGLAADAKQLPRLDLATERAAQVVAHNALHVAGRRGSYWYWAVVGNDRAPWWKPNVAGGSWTEPRCG